MFESPSEFIYRQRFALNQTLPENLVVIIEALAVSKNFTTSNEVIARGVVRQRLLRSPDWTRVVFSNTNKQTFDFDYVLKCKRHFYGDRCDKYCRPTIIPESPSTIGLQSYLCSKTGDRICLPDRGGENCKDVCVECCIKRTCSSVKPCNCNNIIDYYYPSNLNIIE